MQRAPRDATAVDPNPHVPEATRNQFLDLLLEHWPRLAALGRLGFETVGRGAVTLRDGSAPPELGYRPGAPCACHAGAVEGYDPSAEIVLAVVSPSRRRPIWVGVLGGSPGPADVPAPASAPAPAATAVRPSFH